MTRASASSSDEAAKEGVDAPEHANEPGEKLYGAGITHAGIAVMTKPDRNASGEELAR